MPLATNRISLTKAELSPSKNEIQISSLFDVYSKLDVSKTPRQRQIDFVRDKQKRKSRVSIGLKRETSSYASTF